MPTYKIKYGLWEYEITINNPCELEGWGNPMDTVYWILGAALIGPGTRMNASRGDYVNCAGDKGMWTGMVEDYKFVITDTFLHNDMKSGMEKALANKKAAMKKRQQALTKLLEREQPWVRQDQSNPRPRQFLIQEVTLTNGRWSYAAAVEGGWLPILQRPIVEEGWVPIPQRPIVEANPAPGPLLDDPDNI